MKRRIVQCGFAAVVLLIGLRFVLFVRALEAGAAVIPSRPPGVEAFLPISALISLKHTLLTGEVNPVHPSGLVLLLLIMASAVLIKKSFCGWVCPFGLLSEFLSRARHRLIRPTPTMPRWIDIPLRSLKYVLLLFFGWAIFVGMDVAELEHFIYSPYNKIADIKMLKFFAPPSTVTMIVLGALAVLTFLFDQFWCRYLCPYGALLGFLSLVSPFKIRRDTERCIDCGKCARACPSRIRVDRARRVCSDECNACMECVQSCPVPNTLSLSLPRAKAPLPRLGVAVAIVLLFVGGTGLARVLGMWKNRMSVQEYRFHVMHMNVPHYAHNRGRTVEYEHQLRRVEPLLRPDRP